jgi:hypothetical protein
MPEEFSGRMLMHFEDGASFAFDRLGVTPFGPASTPPTVSASGGLVEEAGRFAGIAGTVEFKGRGKARPHRGPHRLGVVFVDRSPQAARAPRRVPIPSRKPADWRLDAWKGQHRQRDPPIRRV